MNELQLKLIKLIEEETSLNDISKALNITFKNIFYQLRLLQSKGFNIDKKYYEDGTIKICFRKNLKDINKSMIYTDENSNEFNFIASSDNHLGSPKQSIENTYNMYDYCIDNNIHIILNCGDFFSGRKPHWKNVKMALLSQFERAIKDYPFDSNILNFIIFGNHDMAYFKEGIDLLNLLNKERYDLIPLDYYREKISVKNEKISLIHEDKYIRQLPDKKLVLYGHYHKYKTDLFPDGNNRAYIGVPSISNISVDGEDNAHGFLDFNIKFKDGDFDEVNIKQLGFKNNKTVLESEISFNYKR